MDYTENCKNKIIEMISEMDEIVYLEKIYHYILIPYKLNIKDKEKREG